MNLAIAALILLGGLTAQGSCDDAASLGIYRISDNDKGLVLLQDEPVDRLGRVKEASEYVKRVRAFVQRCRPLWKDDWAFAIYTDRKYVGKEGGVKDDPAIRRFLVDGTWAKNFLAAYDEKKKELILYPRIPEKMKIVRFISRPDRK